MATCDCLTAGFYGGYSKQLLFNDSELLQYSDYNTILAITPLVRHIHLQSAKGMASLVYRFQRVIKLCLKNIYLSIYQYHRTFLLCAWSMWLFCP